MLLTLHFNRLIMLERFISYIKSNNLAEKTDRILLTVSGGIDSVSMANLFHRAGYIFDIAHCNFKLRGRESDEDQKFVGNLASGFGCNFFCRDFNTTEYARLNNLSIQMAARDLRYQWFNELASENNYPRIAVAHNRNDIVETILLNLFRGTGLKGLTGIMPRRDRIIRPLLFAARNEIISWADKEKINYREDSSNSEIKYQRNLIRSEIVPLIERINPSFTETVIEEAEIFQTAYQLYGNEIENIRRAITIPDKHRTIFSIPKIISLRLTAPAVFDLISCYGFTYSDSKDLVNLLVAEPGRKLISDKFILLKDRNRIIIEKKPDEKTDDEYYINEDATSISKPIKLTFNRMIRGQDFQIPESSDIAVLDNNKLRYPLQLRHWKKGDYFIPLGLKGRKKLSDFFIDRKINTLDKEKIWLLVSENNIVWVAGYQIDDRYKVLPETENILQIELKN